MSDYLSVKKKTELTLWEVLEMLRDFNHQVVNFVNEMPDEVAGTICHPVIRNSRALLDDIEVLRGQLIRFAVREGHVPREQEAVTSSQAPALEWKAWSSPEPERRKAAKDWNIYQTPGVPEEAPQWVHRNVKEIREDPDFLPSLPRSPTYETAREQMLREQKFTETLSEMSLEEDNKEQKALMSPRCPPRGGPLRTSGSRVRIVTDLRLVKNSLNLRNQDA